MHLDSGQEKLLRGEGGEAKRFAMQIVTKVGDAVGADSLVPIKSAHVLAHFSSLHEAGIDVLEKFADSGGKFAVPTSVDPASIDLQSWRSFGIPEEYARQQLRLCDAYARLGGMRCWTCVQYQVCNFPKRGETVAWAESSAVVFANSVLGCRSNKITSGMDVSCAVLGLTPNFGMLKDENRKATVAFRVGPGELSDLDFRSAGFFVGRNSGSKVPALLGLPPKVSSDQVKHLGAAAAAAGPVTMIHMPGITPGSDTLSDATRGERVEEVEISRTDLEEIESDLNQTTEPPDLVAFGVPHLSAGELGELAKQLEGRKLRKGVRMYAYTSAQAFDMAERTGIATTIEASGARVTHSTDAEISPLKLLGFKVVMTNSAKLAEFVSSEGEIKMRYAPQRAIIEEVTR
ncbi:MAG: aconitase X catalytic domain-containing protein [Nitrososphaerota archaeon]|nr:aconitase X catalytic domain-containing protein [Nitrososphaerota archaeon]MDG7023548.1 aconitase X catalytic domain-containing protein [Nitrososphaerota archaeon]